MRLDFDSFVITGPSTVTTSIGKATMGVATGEGSEIAAATQCLTDTFSVSGTAGTTPPTICGTNRGEHGKRDKHLSILKVKYIFLVLHSLL